MWRGSIDIMQISGHKNVASINNYSTLSEERHKKISNILSNTEIETNRNAFQQTYLVKPPQILQPVALLMFTELIHGNVFNNDVKHSNAQSLGYKSFVKIVYTFTICYG
jgi:hypothetical protein